MTPVRKVRMLGLALALLPGTLAARAAAAGKDSIDEERRANAEAAWASRDFEYSAALLMGFTYGSLDVDDREADAPAPFFNAAFEQALSYRVIQAGRTGFGLTLLGRATGTNYDDRSLTETDFSLGPELRLLQRLVRPTVTWRFRITGGYSLGSQGDHPGVAVVESYSNGRGFNVGTAVVAALAGPRWGGFFQFGTFHRFLGMDAQAVLRADPSVRAATRHEYIQHEVQGGGGVLIRF